MATHKNTKSPSNKKVNRKIGKVLGEFKKGKLRSGSKKGPIVANPRQAKAIAISEARKKSS